MRISLVAALALNGVIGRDGGLPWHLPADLKRFKRLTLGHPVIMGRATYESIGRPLPQRRNLVLSRSGFHADGVEVFSHLDGAFAAVAGVEEVMVIGGARVYREVLPRADRLYLSVVHGEFDGDTRFPDIDPLAWSVVATDHVPSDLQNRWAHTWFTLDRRGEGALNPPPRPFPAAVADGGPPAGV
jgi:dihydrofolate reductase